MKASALVTGEQKHLWSRRGQRWQQAGGVVHFTATLDPAGSLLPWSRDCALGGPTGLAKAPGDWGQPVAWAGHVVRRSGMREWMARMAWRGRR